MVLREDGRREHVAGEGAQAGFRAIWGGEFCWDEALAHWTTTVNSDAQLPGAIVFDGVQRSLLLRFPDSAQKIADTVNKGYAIQKVELLLPFDGTETSPLGYRRPAAGILTLWRAFTPRWHAVAWLLRKPWIADDKLGPTFNAFINGAGYWKQYGAQDNEADRYPQQFGPAEISPVRNERLDVTPVLTDSVYGATLNERLTGMEDCGFLLRKLESFDGRYALMGVESAAATGGIGIFLKRPKLVVTLRKAAGVRKLNPLPPPPDFLALRDYFLEDQQGGIPSARMPNEEEFTEMKAQYRIQQPRDIRTGSGGTCRTCNHAVVRRTFRTRRRSMRTGLTRCSPRRPAPGKATRRSNRRPCWHSMPRRHFPPPSSTTGSCAGTPGCSPGRRVMRRRPWTIRSIARRRR